MLNIVGFAQAWRIIPKFTPIIHQKIQKIQVFTLFKIDYNYLDNQIEKQIQANWPKTKIIREVVKCQKPHLQSQISQNQNQPISQISQSQQSKLNKISPSQIQNYVKIQQLIKLKKELQIQRQLRQTHQKLIGLGRCQQIYSAIDNYKKLIENNKNNSKITSAYNVLGQIYQQGKYIPTNRQKSQNYYSQSAKLGDCQGLYKVGKYLQKGFKNQSNKNNKKYQQSNKIKQVYQAIKMFQKAAQSNHLDALTDLGFIYQNGIKFENQQNISNQFQKRQSQISQSNVSTFKDRQYIIEPNFTIALKYYKKAKQFLFPRALNNLGTLLIRQHQYIPQKIRGSNLQKGFNYLKKAAQLNYTKSFYNLGKCYQFGLGAQKDLQKAKNYYTKGSQKGQISCKFQNLKFLLGLKNNDSYKLQQNIDISKIVSLLLQIVQIEPNNAECLYYFGVLYEQKQKLIKNSQLAYNYIKKSAQLKFPPAITKLGDYYYSGFYIDRNISQAVKLYQKAATKGDSQAMLNLSIMIENGMIKSTQSSNKNTIKRLQMEALLKKNSNAFLISGLKQINYKIQNINNKEYLNSKIMQSYNMNNKNALKLIQKIKNNQNKFITQQKEQKEYQLNKFIIEQKKDNQKTVKYGKLFKTKSFQNIKTARN